MLLSEQTGFNLVDATTEWCNKNNMDFEVVGNLLKKDRKFKMHLKKDAIKLNLLK